MKYVPHIMIAVGLLVVVAAVIYLAPHIYGRF